MCKISIIIPVYNVEKYLSRCLDSLINQTLTSLEIILINDCSTDDSLKIMEEYSKRDERIKIIDLKTNQGAATARNKGLKIASGEYLSFIDPDDFVDTNYYEELYRAGANGKYDIVKCPLKIINIDGTMTESSLQKHLKKTKNNYLFSYEWTTAIYKHSIVKENNIDFPDECRKGQDIVFLSRVLLRATSLKLIDSVYYYYNKRYDSLNASKIPLNSIKSALRAIKLTINELNSSNIFSNDKNLYIEIFKNYYNVIFFTLSQCNSQDAKNECSNALIDYFYLCKDIQCFENIYEIPWILKYIKEKNVRKLSQYISKIKNNNYREKPLLWYQKIFCVKNDTRGKYKKFIYFLGLKLNIRKNKLKTLLNELKKDIDELKTKQLKQQIEFSSNNYALKKKINYNVQKYCAIEKREECLKNWYFEQTHELLDLTQPKNYNQKIQWLKLYDSTPLKSKLSDKYQVREYVKNKIGEEYLIPMLGVWDSFDEIDFNILPEQFILKCTHGCGCNIIVKNKLNFNREDAKLKIDNWLNTDFSNFGFELQYSNIPPKIIAEKLLENTNNDLYDYKVWCFNGKAHYVQFLSERNTDGLKMAFYDREWNKQNFVYSVPMDKKNNKKPENLNLLLELAEKLSEGFKHVRVDFYITNDEKIYFGEMTFTSCNGISNWEPKEINYKLGQLIEVEER